MFTRFAIRDLGVLAATALLFALDVAWAGGSGPAVGAVAVGAGVGAGLCAYLLHEWGHLLGALRTRSAFTPARSLLSPFLFSYDSERNDRGQFLRMSFAGFAATGVYLVLFLACLPLDRLSGRVALGIALLLASLTVVIEFPLAWRVWRGRPLPRVEVFRGPGVAG